MKIILILTIGVASHASAASTLILTYFSNATIPDNSQVGHADTRVVSTWMNSIQSLRVSLQISGGWNGDYYAHLVHDSGFAVLLNRIGRMDGLPDGSPGAGMSVTFDDDAPSDIHLAAGMGFDTLIGLFQPDARTADPALVTDASTRSAFLSNFNGLDPNGEWTLFLADLGAGDSGVLVSWSLEIQSVPEPSALLLTAIGLLAGCAMRRRRA